MAGTSRHVYPASAMIGDYLRAAAGLVPTGAVFAPAPVGTVAGTCSAALRRCLRFRAAHCDRATAPASR